MPLLICGWNTGLRHALTHHHPFLILLGANQNTFKGQWVILVSFMLEDDVFSV